MEAFCNTSIQTPYLLPRVDRLLRTLFTLSIFVRPTVLAFSFPFDVFYRNARQGGSGCSNSWLASPLYTHGFIHTAFDCVFHLLVSCLVVSVT
jgi:hypothetical protein